MAQSDNVTEPLMVTASIAVWICRAKFCCVPVMKACGKKKPETQKTRGMPSSIHFRRKAIRAYRVRSHCRLRNRGTDYLSDSGMKRMSRWCTAAVRPSPVRASRSTTQEASGFSDG